MAVLHTVFFRMREDDDAEAKIPDCVTSFNSLKGIKASISRQIPGFAHAGMERFTHAEVMTAESVEALSGFLHSDTHIHTWMPTIKNRLDEIVVFDNALPVPMTGPAGSLVYSLLVPALHLGADETATLALTAGKFPSSMAGINFALFAPYGSGGEDKAGLLSKLNWPDKASSFTHCLTVVATNQACLRQLLESKELSAWEERLRTEVHLCACMVSPLGAAHAPRTG